MSKLFSVDGARYLVVWSAVTLGLAAIVAMVAPLLVEGRWSLSGAIGFVPTAIGIVFVLMLASWTYDAFNRYPLFKGRIWPWIMASAALIAGVAFLVELPLTQLLKPWVYRPDLPGVIFAISATALAFVVAFTFRGRPIGASASWRGELKADLRWFSAFMGTFIALFVFHFMWLDGVAMFSRAVERDPRVNLGVMVLDTLVPLLAIGAMVGYCFNAVLSDPVTRRYSILDDHPDVIQPHDCVWFDYAPRRPFRTIFEERSGKTVPVVVIFGVTGLVVGYVIWPQQWFGSALGCACLGLLASSGYAAIIRWKYRHADLAGPSATLIGRRAFIRENAGRLDFVVMEEDGSPSGRVQVQVPWSDVQEFSKDSYNGVFGLTHARPFKTDWNVVKLVPTSGGPLMVAETLAGDAEIYPITSKLTNLFGAKAREEFLQKRSDPQSHSKDQSSVPSEL